MLRLAFVLITALLTTGVPAEAQSVRPIGGTEERCGWFDNPSPGNAWLHDKDGEWTVAIQGDHQAKGDWPPRFKAGEWIRSGNASYGFGCACLTGKFNSDERNVLEITGSRSKPLSVCRGDRGIAPVERRLR